VGRGNLPAQLIDFRGLAKAVDHEICTRRCKRASDPESNAVCTENLIRVDDVMESPKLAE
jgi:hypothetical protein